MMVCGTGEAAAGAAGASTAPSVLAPLQPMAGMTAHNATNRSALARSVAVLLRGNFVITSCLLASQWANANQGKASLTLTATQLPSAPVGPLAPTTTFVLRYMPG